MSNLKIKLIIIILICINIFSITAINVYAKYCSEWNLECFDINVVKDFEAPTYEIKYYPEKWTNKNVKVKIKFSEEVEGISGFSLINGEYVKELKENEENSFTVRDKANNETIVSYKVDWIDKTPPVITNIETGKKYSSGKIIDWNDEQSGIKIWNKKFYGDLKLGIYEKENKVNLYVLREPQNIVEYDFVRCDNSNESHIKSSTSKVVLDIQDCYNSKFWVVAKSEYGNTYKSNVVDLNMSNLDEITRYLNKEENKELNKVGIYEIRVEDNANNETVCIVEIE